MANLAIFNPPEFCKKKYLFKFELRKSISSMGYKKLWLKSIFFCSAKVDLIKKPHRAKKNHNKIDEVFGRMEAYDK